VANSIFDPVTPGQPPLALRPREAAKALGISDRTLWALTKAGKVPFVRLGRSILYPLHTLREWLDKQTGGVQ
jgi:excisionase family DNA binding protein